MQTLNNICTTVLWLGWRKDVVRGSKIWFGWGNKNTCLGWIVWWMLPDHHILLKDSPLPVLSLNLLLDLIMSLRIVWVKRPGLLLVTSSNKDCYLASNFQEKAAIRGNQYVFFWSSSLVNNFMSSLIYLTIPSGGPDCFWTTLFLMLIQNTKMYPQIHMSLFVRDWDALAPVVLFCWFYGASVCLCPCPACSDDPIIITPIMHLTTLYVFSGMPSICLMVQ